jgi:hypothetical protein
MNKLSRFTSYGIEDEVVEDVVIDETVTDEQAEQAVDQAEDKVEEVNEDVAEMTDVAESLEAICVGIRSTLKTGGLNRQAAAFALQSVDLQLARLGLDSVKASVEDFEEQPAVDPVAEDVTAQSDDGGVVEDAPAGVEADSETVAENVAVTQEAEKTIGERIKAIWDAIVNAIKVFFGKIKEYLVKIWEFFARQAKKLGGFIVTLAKMPGEKFKKLRVKSRMKQWFGGRDIKALNDTFKKIAKGHEDKLKEVEAKLDGCYKKILSKDEEEQLAGIVEYTTISAEVNKYMAELPTVEAAGEKVELAQETTTSNEETVEGEFEVVVESKEELTALAKEAESVTADAAIKNSEKNADGIFKRIQDKASKFFGALGNAASWVKDKVVEGSKAIGRFIMKLGKFIFNGFRKIIGFVVKIVGLVIGFIGSALTSAGVGSSWWRRRNDCR